MGALEISDETCLKISLDTRLPLPKEASLDRLKLLQSASVLPMMDSKALGSFAALMNSCVAYAISVSENRGWNTGSRRGHHIRDGQEFII